MLLIEGYTPDEILELPDEALKAIVLRDEPLLFSAGSAKLLGRFKVEDAALVMELARIFSGADVRTERTIRFALWNNEETGLNGARAYVEQRQALQGKEDPPGSGQYPEPRWLAMIQHDMMMWDHGMPRPDGTWNPEQRPEADVNIEFQDQNPRYL